MYLSMKCEALVSSTGYRPRKLGMESGIIQDTQLSSSSRADSYSGTSAGRLNNIIESKNLRFALEVKALDIFFSSIHNNIP